MIALHHNEASFHRLALGLVLAVCIGTLTFSPRLLMAQEAGAQQTRPAEAQASDPEEFFGQSHRRRLFEESKLSTTRAVLYNLALPGLGNVYAEQYFYGGIAFTLMVFTSVFVGYGVVTEQDQFLWMGAATAGIAYIGSIGTSVHGVREYNQKLRQGLKLEEAQRPWQLPEAPAIGVSVQF